MSEDNKTPLLEKVFADRGLFLALPVILFLQNWNKLEIRRPFFSVIDRAETTSRIVGVDPQRQRSRLQNFDSHDRRLSIITHQSRLSKKYIKIFFIWV